MLVVGDMHFDRPESYEVVVEGKRSNLILEGCKKALEYVLEQGREEESVVFLGDVFERKDRILNSVKNVLVEVLLRFRKEKGLKYVFIVGNHDRNEKGELGIEFLRAYGRVVKKCGIKEIEGRRVLFLPYGETEERRQWLEKGRKEGAEYVFGHVEVAGVMINEYIRQSGDGLLRKEDFKGFRRFFNGHYHLYNEENGTIINVGSIYQTDWGDLTKKYFFRIDKKGWEERIEIPLYIDRVIVRIERKEDIEGLGEKVKDKVVRFDVMSDVFSDVISELGKIECKFRIYNVVYREGVDGGRSMVAGGKGGYKGIEEWCMEKLKAEVEDKERRKRLRSVLYEILGKGERR